MKNYNLKTQEFENTPNEIKDFLSDVEKIYKKHNMSISHEDRHGSFVINRFKQEDLEWIKDFSFFFQD